MGRRKNEEVIKEEVDEVVTEDKEAEEVSEPKKEDIKITASFNAFDEIEQVRVKCVFTGEGESVKDALNVKNTETGQDYPKGINALVTIKAQKGKKVIEKAVAPHRARAILENKDTITFNRVFNGL